MCDAVYQLTWQWQLCRFGPGMVLYWFDFVETVNHDADIYCVNEFPAHMQVLGDINA